MATKTLLSSLDVIYNCALPKDFPTFDVGRIRLFEYEFFADFLSLDIYKNMLESIVDYTGTLEWNMATNYTVGQIVKREGVIYKALNANTAMRPPNNDWELAPKFNNDCFNNVWCDGFLSVLLSYKILDARLPFIANAIHSEGVGTANEKFIKSSHTGFVATANAVKSNITTLEKNFQNYLKFEGNCLNLPLNSEVKPCEETQECGCPKKSCGCGSLGTVQKKQVYDIYKVA